MGTVRFDGGDEEFKERTRTDGSGEVPPTTLDMNAMWDIVTAIADDPSLASPSLRRKLNQIAAKYRQKANKRTSFNLWKIYQGMPTTGPKPSNTLNASEKARLIERANHYLKRRSAVLRVELGDPWHDDNVYVRDINTVKCLHEYDVKSEIHGAKELIDFAKELALNKFSITDTDLDKKRAAAFTDGGGFNDAVGVRIPSLQEWWEQETFQCRSMDYASYQCLVDAYRRNCVNDRDYLNRPLVPGANSVIVSNIKKHPGVLMQRRPLGSLGGTNRGRLSLFGGACQPQWNKTVHDYGDLQHTVVREVFEEAGIVLCLNPDPPVALVDEIKVKSQAQYSFLGTSIDDQSLVSSRWTKGQSSGLTAALNDEGGIEIIGFDELAQGLLKRTWEFSCHSVASLLCWLAVGVPGTESVSTLGDLSPQDLFDQIVNSNEATLKSSCRQAEPSDLARLERIRGAGKQ